MQLEAPPRSPGLGRQTCYERTGASPEQVVEAAGALDKPGFATDNGRRSIVARSRNLWTRPAEFALDRNKTAGNRSGMSQMGGERAIRKPRGRGAGIAAICPIHWQTVEIEPDNSPPNLTY
jgi:hypothetical protein